MEVRPYRDADAAATRRVFEAAVRVSAASDYNEAQLKAWAPSDIDDAARADGRRRGQPLAQSSQFRTARWLGFCDLVNATLLDMLYVDPQVGRRGIGSALIAHVVALARTEGASQIQTDASLTARPVFERHGFVVLEQQTPVVRGVAMTNFKMRLNLGDAQ